VLSLSRLPDGEVSLDEFLLELISLGYGLVVMLEDLDAILQFLELLLRETLDLTRFQHLKAFHYHFRLYHGVIVVVC
jgi:hypothetical protein